MIRSQLYRLATRASAPNKLFSLQVVRPAAVAALSSGHCVLPAAARSWFSTKIKHDDELLEKTFSDEFDESDSLEKGKQELTKKQGKAVKIRDSQHMRPFVGRHPFFDRSFFDDFFAPSSFWNRGDPFAPFFARRDPFMDIMPVLHSQIPRDPAMTLLRSSPGYEIKESNEAYEIAVDVPDGVGASDMTVELENDGTVLHLSGGRKVEEEGVSTETRFDQHFTIGTLNVDSDKISANLSDGVLTVTVPKLQVEAAEEEEEQKHTIPITEK
jgi:HSP20 family protein